MKNLFEPARVAEIKERIAKLTPDNERRWGTMTPAQVVKHCVRGMEMATGELNLPRIFLGRVLGPLIGTMVFKDDKPFNRNAPTAKGLVVRDEPNFEEERERLLASIDRFVAAGPVGCTKHPHAFFGRMNPDQWAILAYKHLDHHLRQFGA